MAKRTIGQCLTVVAAASLLAMGAGTTKPADEAEKREVALRYVDLAFGQALRIDDPARQAQMLALTVSWEAKAGRRGTGGACLRQLAMHSTRAGNSRPSSTWLP